MKLLKKGYFELFWNGAFLGEEEEKREDLLFRGFRNDIEGCMKLIDREELRRRTKLEFSANKDVKTLIFCE